MNGEICIDLPFIGEYTKEVPLIQEETFIDVFGIYEPLIEEEEDFLAVLAIHEALIQKQEAFISVREDIIQEQEALLVIHKDIDEQEALIVEADEYEALDLPQTTTEEVDQSENMMYVLDEAFIGKISEEEEMSNLVSDEETIYSKETSIGSSELELLIQELNLSGEQKDNVKALGVHTVIKEREVRADYYDLYCSGDGEHEIVLFKFKGPKSIKKQFEKAIKKPWFFSGRNGWVHWQVGTRHDKSFNETSRTFRRNKRQYPRLFEDRAKGYIKKSSKRLKLIQNLLG